MTTLRVRFSVCLFACFLVPPHVNAAVSEPSQQATVTTEPSGPAPSAAVEKMLSESRRLAEAKQPLDSLKAADQALEAARQTKDRAGEALAQQARAKVLHDLQRTSEAVTAWQEAAQMWALAGDTPEQITALVQAGLLCLSDKKGEAEKFFRQGLSRGKSETQSLEAVAQALHDSGVALGAQEEVQTSMDYLSAALSIREKETPDSLKLAETLNALSKLSLDRAVRNNDDHECSVARDYLVRALEIGQRLAPNSPIVVESLHRLADAEYDLSVNDLAANEHYLAALHIQEQIVPGGSMEQLSILVGLGGLEDRQADFPLAQQHLEEAVAIGGRLAPESLELEHSLENLAGVEEDEGDLTAARAHMERALSIREKLPGSIAPTLINLGALAFSQADFASARTYFEKALALAANVKHVTAVIPFALAGLSDTFYRQGDLRSALEYRRRALAYDEQNYGVNLSTANDLNGMGDILVAQRNLSLAADYYHRALDMRQKLAAGSLEVVDSLSSLAKLARARRDLPLAVQYDRRALELKQKSCPNSWCVGDILNDLGELAYEQGDLLSAVGYLRHVVDIREKSLGPMHPDLGRSLNDLALADAALGKTQEAFTAAMRAERIGADHLRVSVRTLSERRALAYEGIRASGLDLALTLAADPANTPSARSEAFDAVIRSRALVFDELAARHRSAYGSRNPEITQLADQLFSARTRLATLVFRGVGDTKPDTYRKLLDDAREKKEKAERMLAEKSITFRQDQARMQLGIKEIAASLPPGAALVAFVHYSRHDLQRPGAGKAPPTPDPSYAAFVLQAGTHEPVFVELGAAREIEGLLFTWRRNIARQVEAMEVSTKTSEYTYRRSGAALRRRIWDPLVPGLGDAKEVLVVPDAALNLVSLAALPVGSSQYLVETGPLIHHLSAERDLVPAQSHHGEGILVVGNPAFDHAGKLVVAANKPSAPTSTTAGPMSTLFRGTRSACGTFQTLRFPPLPGSQQEAENIAALWKRSSAGEGVQIMRGPAVPPGSSELLQMTGDDASAEAFEQYAPGKRVLHVATHGFFLEGSCESAVQRRFDANKWDKNFLPATAESPLLLSGLAFAGANRRASAKPEESDGILTAEEIAGINLEGVDWAVLSACDTGMGEIKAGEGVFGLRRAFQVAGAKTVIMSLWPVEDEMTRQWMGSLYREHFLNGRDTVESVRAASLQVLRQRRARHQSTHPFYWGAFIAVGDWH
jgi:tetratricopeptide (TPR) repeat protein